MARVALASLEAEPTYVRLFGHYGYGDRCWLECGKSEEAAQPFYTAQTVPQLKLPPEYKVTEDMDLGAKHGFESGYRKAIKDIKRLNGVKS